MSTIKSSAENLTLNADGANNDIIFQSNGSNVATLDQAGLLTATSFAGSGASLTALNATNLGSGTVPTARLGTGTADSSVHLRGDGTWAAAGGGKILQVVESILGTSVDKSTGGGRTDIISGTITPSATTSKIWVMVQLTYYKQGTGSSNSGYQINRRISGLSDVSIDSQYWHYADTPDTNWMLHYPVQKIDSPSSTAAVTYVFDVTNSGSNTMSFLLNGTKIILLEIGA